MKRIKAGEYKSAVCAWCGQAAVLRSSRITGKYACDTHSTKLLEAERESQDSGYMTEADYQTWGRL